MLTQLQTFEKIGNNTQGYLSVMESMKTIPFKIERVYYVYGVGEHQVRGKHAHRQLDQILWCPYGEIEVVLEDQSEKKSVVLNQPNQYILVEKGVWHEMIWHIDQSVLCVVASDVYQESDYVRDYNEYKKMISEGYWDESRF